MQRLACRNSPSTCCRPPTPATYSRSAQVGALVDRRDTAIILFLDTGMRLLELAGLSVDDLEMEADVALLLGKGRVFAIVG